MTRLGEVLGALLTDVVRARLAADALTARAVDAYRDDPILASFSVPRVTVADMTVRLAFSAADVAVPEPPPLDVVRAARQWNVTMRDKVLPRLLSGREELGLDEAVKQWREALRRDPVALDAEALQRAVDGDSGPLVDSALGQLLERLRALPRALQARLEQLRLKEELRPELHREASSLAEQSRQWQAAEQALRSRVEVEVTADQLEQRRPETLQHIELTVSLVDIEELIGPATDTEA
ncbi:hypothetical protein ACFS5L_05850 [Streptomyces phyllanthi]|uniref:Uncharacterized protein n=1 Tax=Streptomyces phyllanthi TaxID=1803180 RepID=A0A5N8VV41_9ACTN|nr:hypothetical protein [Streptomyces phyllanthi]MPY39130.1 hypothetical protein [Streptomyces phyllanthi]